MKKINDMEQCVISPESILDLMKNVVSVTVDLYPKSYETDARFVNMLKPYLKSNGISLRKKTITFELFIDDVIQIIEKSINIEKYLKEFNSEFRIEDGVSKNYDKLIEKYSSPEILLLFRFYTNLMYFTFNIHSIQDTRKTREKNIISLQIPDLKIETISIRLRNYCNQNITDCINKFLISENIISGHVMTRSNAFMVQGPESFLIMLDNICKNNEFNQEIATLMKNLVFLGLPAIQNAQLIIQTDWPII